MFKTPKLKEHSFLVYGLGITGSSVIKFFKKKKISNFKVYDDKHKNLFKKFKIPLSSLSNFFFDIFALEFLYILS